MPPRITSLQFCPPFQPSPSFAPLSCSSERYGALCPLLGPVYFNYGDALLQVVESKQEVLGEKAGGEEDSDDEESESEQSGNEGGAAASSSSGNKASGGAAAGGAAAGGAAAGQEEDLEGEGDDDSDWSIAMETLEVARVIYSKMDRNEVRCGGVKGRMG